MQHPRRPSGDLRRASGSRNRSWSRRLEEAREERARVLATRKAGGAAAVSESGENAAQVGLSDVDPAESPSANPWPFAGEGRAPWWIAGGFLAGALAGAAALWIMLSDGRTLSSGAGRDADVVGEDVTAPQPRVPPVATATAMREAPADEGTTAREAAPVDEATTVLPAATGAEAASLAEAPTKPEAARTEAAANDGAMVDAPSLDAPTGAAAGVRAAELPKMTAADRARAARRTGVATAGSVTGTVPETSEAQVSAAPPLPEGGEGIRFVTAMDFPTGPSGRVETDDVAAGSSQADVAEPSAASDGVVQELASATEREADGEPASTPQPGEVAAGADPASDAASGAAAEPASEDVTGAVAGTDAEAAPPRAEPAPVADPPRPPDAAEASARDAAGSEAPQEAREGGRGSLYVHAAPRVTAEELADVVARLSGGGYAVEETRRVDFRISRTNVRYFHPEDAELSAGVAEALSGVSRDFTDYEPSPDPGTIEVWLEG